MRIQTVVQDKMVISEKTLSKDMLHRPDSKYSKTCMLTYIGSQSQHDVHLFSTQLFARGKICEELGPRPLINAIGWGVFAQREQLACA